MSILTALVSGLLFGLGLLLSGMTDPSKVKGFLDLFGTWDPSLGLVMGGAIAVGLVGFALARKRTTAWSGEPIDLPKPAAVDGRLILGGILFGIGWGIGGFCPGPGLVSASSGSLAGLGFVLAMLIGMTIHDRLIARR